MHPRVSLIPLCIAGDVALLGCCETLVLIKCLGCRGLSSEDESISDGYRLCDSGVVVALWIALSVIQDQCSPQCHGK